MMPRFQPGDYDDFGDPRPGNAGGDPDAEFGQSQKPRPVRRSSGMALASLVCGVMFCIPLIPSVFATIFGMIALRETRDRSVSGRGLAITGTILGVFGTGLWLLVGALFYLGLNQYFIEKSEVEVVSKAFLQDLGDGKLDAALARSMPGIDRKPLEEASLAMKPWGPLNSLVGTYTPILTRRQDELRWKVDADAIFSRGSCEVMIELVKDGSPYRVERFTWKTGR